MIKLIPQLIRLLRQHFQLQPCDIIAVSGMAAHPAPPRMLFGLR